MLKPPPGVINQVIYPGVGDTDDCNVITPFWTLIAGGVLKREQLPTVKAFRAAAGVPDEPGQTGLTNAQALKAIKALVPKAKAVGEILTYTRFVVRLARGNVISLSVDSAKLPARLRFGFFGNHQIGVVYYGGLLLVANPLASEGSAPLAITEKELRAAAEGLFNDGRFHSVLIPEPVVVDTHLAEIAILKTKIAKAAAALE